MLGMIFGVCELCFGAMTTAMVKDNTIEKVVYPHCCIQEAGSASVLTQPT